MNRRRFAFWIGLALFNLAEKLRATPLDAAAATLMTLTDAVPAEPLSDELWEPNENRTWRWFERFTRRDGEWTRTGITRPVNKETGELHDGEGDYLDEGIVPEHTKAAATRLRRKLAQAKVDPECQARDGRPPSEWLRSLNADEIRIWLRTIEVPEVGVGGMTFWTHLTRDHYFSAPRIDGLTVAEQAKLHSAAHYGY